MIIYIFLFILLFFNIICFKKNKKLFIIFSFSALFLVAALRKYTIGIDLNGHYANNFLQFSKMNWDSIINLIKSNNSFYDSGLILFMKIISLISSNVQFFIIVTSAITYGLVGRYIYKHSKNVYLETFLFFTTFTYFMYMNIIAQGLAVAIILYSIDYLERKSYIKFVLLVLLANCIHSSAIICLLFILFSQIKFKKNNIKITVLGSIIILLFLDKILPIIIKYLYPQFAFYFKNQFNKGIDKMQLVYMLLYIIFLIISLCCNFSKLSKKNIEYEKEMNNFLLCTAILSVITRYMGMNIYIFSRMGFYFYMFSCTFFVQSIEQIEYKKNKSILKLCTYLGMTLFFILLNKSLDVSYGVVPYQFFWK